VSRAHNGAQIGALARHVHGGHERRARRDHDWNKGMAVAEAAGRVVGKALADLSQRLEPGEALVDLAHIERYTVGPRGAKVTLTMLVATNRRQVSDFVDHRRAVQPRLDGDWAKALVSWVEDIGGDRPQTRPCS
jgi:hypothetical protein